MRDFKRKKLLEKNLFAYGVIVVLFVSTGMLTVSVFERFTVEREMSARRIDAENELDKLRLRATALEAQVEYLEDERGMESEIRSRFDVVKEGEQVVIILDDQESEEDPVEEEELKDLPWYKFW